MIDTNKIVPDGFILLQTQNGTPKYAACMTGRLAGWLMKKYPDGNWVSERKLTNLEVMQAEDQRDDGIVHETPAATIQEPVMVAEPVAWYADTTYDLNEDKQGDWPVELRSHRAFVFGAKRPTSKWDWKPLGDLSDLSAPMVVDPAGVELAAQAIFKLLGGNPGVVWVPGGNSFKQDEARDYARAALAATVKAVPSEALDSGPFTLEQRMPPKDTEVLIYWPCSDGTFGCAVDEWSDLYEDPIGMGGPTICVGEGWMRYEADVTHWAPIPVVNFADPLADKTGGGE